MRLPLVTSVPGLVSRIVRRSFATGTFAVALFASLLVSLFSTPALAVPGVAIHVEVRETGAEPVQQQIHIVGQSVKVDVTGDRRGSVVFRGGTDELLTIDHDRKEFMRVDKASIERMASTVSGAVSQVDGLLANLPEDQRAMIEGLIKDKLPQAAPTQPKRPLLRSTGKRATHGGQDTRQVEVLVDGSKRSEFWIAAWTGIDGRVKTAMEDLSGFMKGVIDKLPASMTESIKTSGYEVIGDLGGMPMLTREFDETGKVAVESRVTSIVATDIDVAGFNPPAGYTQKSLPL